MTAGGSFHGKVDPKKTKFFGVNNTEILKDSQTNAAPKKFSLNGILGLNQTVEINKASPESPSWTKEFLGNPSLPKQQEKQLLNQEHQELEKAVSELQSEIKKITTSISNPEKNIENIGLINIPEPSDYHVNFLERIKNYISKNINEANSWLESFSHKKKKKNYFWSMAKSKKGGEQYLMSSEHSASRSVN